MSMKGRTKNLSILYQKQLNLAIDSLNLDHQQNQYFITLKQKIKNCFSLSKLKAIIKEHPELRKQLCRLAEQGGLLHSIVTKKGQFRNTAITLKFFNIFLNMIYNPGLGDATWTAKYQNQTSGNQSDSKNQKEISTKQPRTKQQFSIKEVFGKQFLDFENCLKVGFSVSSVNGPLI